MREIDMVSELPASAYQLRHLGKARPRRSKTRAPTRPVVGEEQAELDSGLDVFFPPAHSLPSSPLTSPDSESRQLMTTSADNTPQLGLERVRVSSSLRDDDSSHRQKKGGGAVKKGISSVFSKLAADRVARSREDRDADSRPAGTKSADAADSDSSAGSGSADSFLNHLLTPPVVPAAGDEPESALRRPTGLAGADLLAEMRAKQEKRASLTPKHTPEEPEERSPVLSPLQGARGRAAAPPAGRKSPVAGDDRPPSVSPKPSLPNPPKQASPVPGLYKPPPLGPKPRPKSTAFRSENRCSGGNTSGDETTAPPADSAQSSAARTSRQAASEPGEASPRAETASTEPAGELS